MTREVTVTPPNSVVLVMDSQGGQIPESMGGNMVSATSSCVAIGTLEESEGPTQIRIVDASTAKDEELPTLEVIDAMLAAPSGLIIVRSVLGERYVEWPLDRPEARVRVYVSHSVEPGEIAIVMG